MHPEQVLRRAGIDAPAPRPLSGGDVSSVARAGDVVIKTHRGAPPDFFEAEARGLRALASAGVRVPGVRWVGAEGLVIDWLEPGPADWSGLAEQLAHLHRSPPRGQEFPVSTLVEGYGCPHPYDLGSFGLPAGTGAAWAPTWRRWRVEPLLQATRGRLGGLATRVRRLLDTFEPPTEGPVLIHGDLWSGNLHMSAEGPALIDPSAWWGERGVDLAMMELFGGFPGAFWDAYEALYPVPAGVREAIPFYQLYYLLVHVQMFGGGYVSGVERVLRRYGV